jgi:hypothetical protein
VDVSFVQPPAVSFSRMSRPHLSIGKTVAASVALAAVSGLRASSGAISELSPTRPEA